MVTDVTETYAARQYPRVAVVEFDYSTFTEDEVYQVFKLPGGAIITDVALQVKTAFDNTTPIFSVGLYSHSTTQPDNFLDAVSLGTGDETFQASMFSADEEAVLDNSDDNKVSSEGDEIAVLYAATSGTATAGAAVLIVKYLDPAVSDENKG